MARTLREEGSEATQGEGLLRWLQLGSGTSLIVMLLVVRGGRGLRRESQLRRELLLRADGDA